MNRLSDDDIREQVARLRGWEQAGGQIRKTYPFASFAEGMVFAIEPMINAGRPGIRCLADGWTVVTADHSLSAQWEHTVLVTDTGYEVLTLSPGTPAPPATS